MRTNKLSAMRSRCFLLAVSAIFFTSSLLAQSAGTGALTGTVTDATGGVVPRAQVTLVSTDTNQSRAVTTGADGVYKFALLPPGTYRVRFSAPGFKTAEVSAITVNVTETPVLDRALEVGSQSEQVTVEAHSSPTFSLDGLLNGFRDVGWVYRFGAPSIDSVTARFSGRVCVWRRPGADEPVNP